MGLYKQPNDWSCGPFALKHALVVLGRLADARRIARLARTHWWSGTDEVRLARAARSYDCEMPLVRRTDPDRARQALARYLARRIPVLLCVDGWEHWLTVVHHQHGRFVVLDSAHDPVVNVLTWPELRARWRYVGDPDLDEPPARYDLHPVKPRFHVEVVAQFSVARAHFLRRPQNLGLARHWDQFLDDLLDVCRPRSTQQVGALSMGEFLRRHRDLLLDRVAHWHGIVSKVELARLLRYLRFVAETYGLVIPETRIRRGIADIAIILTLWAAATHGVDPMYGSGPPGKRREIVR